jgi:hypothetical protein
MDFTATLTPAELEALSNYDHHSLQDAAQNFDRMTVAVGYSLESAFEKSLRIKNTLDVFEEQSRARPSEKILAVVLNCEYLLWRLHADISLKYNPFLSYPAAGSTSRADQGHQGYIRWNFDEGDQHN